MDKDKLIKVTNRNTGTVGYKIPDTGVRRQFSARETKELTFDELQRLVYVPGGLRLLKEYLIVKDVDALKELQIDVQPEYFYTEADVEKLLKTGSLNEFLDCLDFAPDGVIDIIKKVAVSLPLDNMSKRDALLRKTGFDVTKAIEIQSVKADGEVNEKEESPIPAPEQKVRRSKIPDYKVVTEKHE